MRELGRSQISASCITNARLRLCLLDKTFTLPGYEYVKVRIRRISILFISFIAFILILN
jgi:hypothetical protein